MCPKAGFVRKSFFGVFRGNSGSGTLLGLGVVFAAVTLLLASNLAVYSLIGQEKLQAQAEQIALAAADSLRGLATGYPCAVADQFAHMYMVKIAFCRIVGFECFLRLQSERFGIRLEATARAGPPPEGN
jgi:secretion/DNA translocation related TadE-like protein